MEGRLRDEDRLKAEILREIFDDLYDNEEWKAACLIAKRLLVILSDDGDTGQ